jgi:cytochrome c oxidase assembly factor CtaG
MIIDTLIFLLVGGVLWWSLVDIRRGQRTLQASLERITQIQHDIARFLGTERR